MDINHRNGGVTEGDAIGKGPAECGRTLDKVWRIFTPPIPPPAQAEGKAKVCLVTVNDPLLGKQWPFGALQHTDN